MREGVKSNQHALIWITTTAKVANMGTKVLEFSLTLSRNLYLSKSLSKSKNSGGVLRYTFSGGIC